MPKRTDLSSILIIGAGPIVIGQACEFDYSGAQACRTLREEGYRVILANSNPATIMTDPEIAHATYVEPLTPAFISLIIDKEKPDAILPTMGGQTALNITMELHRSGKLEQSGVELIGATAEAIAKAEDRELFRKAMERISIPCPKAITIHDSGNLSEIVTQIGLPAIIRPSFTLGGMGGGIAYNREEFADIVEKGLAASPVGQILVEESVLGWKEFEMEVIRDHADNCIIVCSIENIDPMGVHTGDSITVAPALTLTDKEYQQMRDAAIAVLREIGVDTGGSNVQFAVEPTTGRMVVIEMNPRVSRSSALASKATGFPIAKVATCLAVGYRLDELTNAITGVTPASFEPALDYVVVKVPRFTFEKFPSTSKELSISMRSVGEVMAIGRSFPEALQKALRSTETGLTGLDEIFLGEVPDEKNDGSEAQREALLGALTRPHPDRLRLIAQALRAGISIEAIHERTRFDPWFLDRISEIVEMENEMGHGDPTIWDRAQWVRVKHMGFSDARIATISSLHKEEITHLRQVAGVRPVFKRIDSCAGEFPTNTTYLYATYEHDFAGQAECEATPSDRKKAIILGSGPNRIGQGIEFDYCCVHAALALKERGIEAIMINCNPETVSTDFDISDRLYFEPLTEEDVLEIIHVEQRRGQLLGVIVQMGGQTPLKIAGVLAQAGTPILGADPQTIDLAEDRDRFQRFAASLGLRQPRGTIAYSLEEADTMAEGIGYPVLVRPSYVLGGRAMEVVYSRNSLRQIAKRAFAASGASSILIDEYLTGAVEIDVDALADQKGCVHIAGVMEHIEEAGIHSGDSACSIPPFVLKGPIIDEIRAMVCTIAQKLRAVGLINLQAAICEGLLYVLEVNPRASRTVPFVAKATGLPIARIATHLMFGEGIDRFGLPNHVHEKLVFPSNRVAIKEAVFPFRRFPNVDILLGPEMRSTGEVMGIDRDFARAFLKSQIAAGMELPRGGRAFISVRDADKPLIRDFTARLLALGFSIIATHGTAQYLRENGVEVETVKKIAEGRPNIVDLITDGEISLVFNTTEGSQTIADSIQLRRGAILNNLPYFTTINGAQAAVQALAALREGGLQIQPLQELHPHPAFHPLRPDQKSS